MFIQLTYSGTFLDRVGTTCWMAAFLRNPNAMSMMFSEVPLGLFFQLGMDCAWHIFDQFWLMMLANMPGSHSPSIQVNPLN